MKIIEKSNHFNFNKKVLNIYKHIKNYKFRYVFRYFLKKNLYNLLKKKIIIMIRFKTNFSNKNRIKIKNKSFIKNKNYYNSIKTINNIYIIKKENFFNRKTYVFNNNNIKKIFIIKNKYNKKKFKYNKKKFKYNRKKFKYNKKKFKYNRKKIILIKKLFFFLLKKKIFSIKTFRYYKSFFNVITIKRDIEREINYKKIDDSKTKFYKKRIKKAKINFNFSNNKLKFINNKYNNSINTYKNFILKKKKFKYVIPNKKRNRRLKNYLIKYDKIINIKKVLNSNLTLINNIKNILNFSY